MARVTKYETLDGVANENRLHRLVRLTCKAVTCPRFVVIKMRISSKDWEKCVSQCSSGSIEGVAVTMLSVKMSLLKFLDKMLVNPGYMLVAEVCHRS